MTSKRRSGRALDAPRHPSATAQTLVCDGDRVVGGVEPPDLALNVDEGVDQVAGAAPQVEDRRSGSRTPAPTAMRTSPGPKRWEKYSSFAAGRDARWSQNRVTCSVVQTCGTASAPAWSIHGRQERT